ncbi:protein-L-isoaspartate O-methyltransferase family protein [Hoeflea prorocentri]|uniref:Protein-L-isoaspartate O-methyltransferase n=1 Tax=Hoeflea prorocentri TaxID=1922333 RepID=A0A9X3UJF4_9HYPH|nr:SAM-dependent methyltransferase [Hoeflea prorocentri]MCY6382472.1 SAM-dependent methyltransferase [Hoeflea prorocentri]MDA5400272.1 SAM-dependent methyltransferase [Hoeflea prorocentri]
MADDLQQERDSFARMMAAAGGADDPRFEAAVRAVPREAFLGPPPWRIVAIGRQSDPLVDDPRCLYRNVLISLDESLRINNGEPYLHARWIVRADPKAGDLVTHIGAGTGYYSAILARLVSPGGHVDAIEIEQHLARAAAENLRGYENVSVRADNAVVASLSPSDVIYVNAGVVEPPLNWLDAFKDGGRMILPWCPWEGWGVALLVRARGGRLNTEPFMPVGFIPCQDASDVGEGAQLPGRDTIWSVRSIRRTSKEQPDKTAVASFKNVWFSSEPA